MFPILISCVPMATVFHLTSLKVSLSLLPSYISTSSLRLTQYKWLHLKCWASVRCCFIQLCSNPHKKTLKRANINVEQSSSVFRIWKRIPIGILFQILFHYSLLQDTEYSFLCYIVGFPGGSEVKASAHDAGDLGSIPG